MPTYEEMLAAGMHLGRKKSVFHPNMKPYVYTVRDDLHVIDLIKTQEGLVRVIGEIQKVILDGGLVLFVGLTKQSRDAVKELADSLDMPFVQDRWIGGTLSNYKVISSRVKDLKNLEERLKSEEMAKYTKKERLDFEREYQKMEGKFGGLRKLVKMPDLIFVTSLKNSAVVVRETRRINVKTIGIVNTDANPKLLDIPIPASDTSRKAVELILQTIKNSVKK